MALARKAGPSTGAFFVLIEAEAAAIRFRIFRKSRNADWGLLAELRQDHTGAGLSGQS